MRRSVVPAIHYRVEVTNLHAHLFSITLTVPRPAPQQTLRLPAWIPGSYLVREFAKNLQNLQARQGRRAVAALQTDKASWVLDCTPDQPLEVRYEVYAFDNSVRTAGWTRPAVSSTAPACACRWTASRTRPTRWSWSPARAWKPGRSPPDWMRSRSTNTALAATPPPTTTRWWTARWRWGR
jgi:predicted metalloprotease with PDZ domain